MGHSAFRLIPYILKQVNDSQSTIDPLKLQKLLYYVQAWSLVLRDCPIFSEPLEAWIHGPVIPSVYRNYRAYGYQTILTPEEYQPVRSDEAQVLDMVCETYGTKTGTFLEDLTHSEDPWIQARSGLKSHQRSSRKISLKSMTRYYSKFLQSKQPPQIKSEALRPRMKPTPSRTTAFMLGMGSVLDVMPQSQSGLSYFVTEDFADPISDVEALQSDWSVVGSCIEKAIKPSDSHE